MCGGWNIGGKNIKVKIKLEKKNYSFLFIFLPTFHKTLSRKTWPFCNTDLVQCVALMYLKTGWQQLKK